MYLRPNNSRFLGDSSVSCPLTANSTSIKQKNDKNHGSLAVEVTISLLLPKHTTINRKNSLPAIVPRRISSEQRNPNPTYKKE